MGWVNVTASVTITYKITIDTLIVVEGDCRGSTTTHYHWIDEETDFDIEVEIEAHDDRANGTVAITAPFLRMMERPTDNTLGEKRNSTFDEHTREDELTGRALICA